MPQEVIEVTEREVEIIEVIERGPVGPQGPQPNINYEVVSSARTLEAADLIAADTSGGAFTLTLPANPNNGDAVDIFDFSETFDTNPLTIARNGQPIESLNEDLVANVEGAYFTLIYTGSTRGWQVLPRYGTSGGGGESALTTQGDMLYRGVGINTRLPIGSAGQILKVNSGATAPEWGEAPATGVTSVSGTAPIASSGGATPTISISPATTSAAGSMSSADKTKLDGIAANANNYTHPNHSGEVTSSGDGATTIANDVVTNAKLANVATATIKGRATAGTGDPEDLTASQVRTILNVADGAEVNVNADWNASSGDAQILNKPASFTPSAHGSTHHTGGADAIAPNQISAAWAQVLSNQTITANTLLSAGRNRRITLFAFGATANVDLPYENNQAGDVVTLVSDFVVASTLTIRSASVMSGGTPLAYTTLATLNASGQSFTFVSNGTATGWSLRAVDTHTHPSTQITGLGTAATQDSTAFAPATGIDPTAITGTAVVDSDARLSDSRTPSSHSSSHASSGSDPLAPSDIGAQSIFVQLALTTGVDSTPYQLSTSRAIFVRVFSTENFTIRVPASGHQIGDIVEVRAETLAATKTITVQRDISGSGVWVTLGTLDIQGQKRRFRATSTASNGWQEDSYFTTDGTIGAPSSHTHAASAITSGTLDIARIPTGTGSTQVALGDHTHTQLHDRSHAVTSTSDHTAGNHKVFYSDGSGQIQELALGNSGEVLTSNGATSAPSFAAASGGIGGSTGATDNAILRADGTGGATAQASNLVIGDEVRSFTGVTGNASTDIITVTGSGFSNGQRVRFTALTGGSGLNTTTNYFVINASGDTFQVSTTEGGSFVNFTTNITAGTLLNGHFTQVHTQISNTGADTDIPLVVTPQGTGAFILGPPPDNTTTGGNARGADAIDLQKARNSASRVASGQRSFVSGESNTASGNSSFVAGGLQNVASASPSFATGANSTASGYAAAAFAGATASGNNSFATGGFVVADRSYMVAFGGGRFGGNTGSAQRAFLTVFERTTTDSAAELLTGSDAQGLRRRFTIPSGEAVGATIQIVGTTSGNKTANYYLRQCLIRNLDGTTELVGSVQTIGTDITGVTVGGITISASDANDALVIEATGYTPVTGCTADAGTDVISKTAHGFSNNDDIVFTSLTGGAGLTVSTVTYWVIDATADTFKVSATRGGGAVNITTNYTDMTATRVIRWVANIHATEVIAGITGHS